MRWLAGMFRRELGVSQSRGAAGSPWRLGRERADQRRPLPGSSLTLLPAHLPGWPREHGGHQPGFGAPRPQEPPPAPRPWQAAGSAGDESRSLASPLAAIAAKLEQRPANKAPPPRCQKLCISFKCPPGNLPIYSCYLHDKGCSAAFSAACLKKAGKLEEAGGQRSQRGQGSRPGAGEGAAPAAPPLGAGRGGGRKAGSLQPGLSLSSFVLISGSVLSLRSSQRGLFWQGNVPSGVYWEREGGERGR